MKNLGMSMQRPSYYCTLGRSNFLENNLVTFCAKLCSDPNSKI